MSNTVTAVAEQNGDVLYRIDAVKEEIADKHELGLMEEELSDFTERLLPYAQNDLALKRSRPTVGAKKVWLLEQQSEKDIYLCEDGKLLSRRKIDSGPPLLIPLIGIVSTVSMLQLVVSPSSDIPLTGAFFALWLITAIITALFAIGTIGAVYVDLVNFVYAGYSATALEERENIADAVLAAVDAGEKKLLLLESQVRLGLVEKHKQLVGRSSLQEA